jgi:hypothetical protein
MRPRIKPFFLLIREAAGDQSENSATDQAKFAILALETVPSGLKK